MAVVVIGNSCIAGAMGGLMAGRFQGSIDPTQYAALANVAAAINTEFLAENALLSVPLADASNAEIGAVVQQLAYATVVNTGCTSTTATDYLGVGKQIAAAGVAALAKLS